MKYDYDVIVAGAGIGGTLTASTIMKNSPSLKVLLIDRNPEPVAGRKTGNGWICGDAVLLIQILLSVQELWVWSHKLSVHLFISILSERMVTSSQISCKFSTCVVCLSTLKALRQACLRCSTQLLYV